MRLTLTKLTAKTPRTPRLKAKGEKKLASDFYKISWRAWRLGGFLRRS
jgi:hypothetical protein